MVERVAYDEFGLFHENASEYGLAFDGPPTVQRSAVPMGDGRHLSALVWGSGEPELFFCHGGAQNAHTWDTVALALGSPLVAIDLPGHGHSDGPAHGSMISPEHNATDVARAVERLAPNADAVIGMSLGGLTSIALVGQRPDLVRRLILVDITPGVTAEKAQAITNFVRGPATFASFEDLLARTIEHNPTRTEASLRRGILHNALQLDDGSWVWRYRRDADQAQLVDSRSGAGGDRPMLDYDRLWDVLEASTVPVLLVRGMLPQSVIAADDVEELLRRRPDAVVVEVTNAGHSVQGDTPVELAEIIRNFVG